MKISALIAAALGIEALKPLATQVQTELGEHADLDAREVGQRIKDANSQVADLTNRIKTLSDSTEENKKLKADSAVVAATNRKLIVKSAFGRAAAKYGVRPEAVETSFKIADTSKLTVEGEDVVGLNQEFFETLKKSDPIFFGPANTNSAAPAVGAIPPPPPAGSTTAGQEMPAIAGPVGAFLTAFKA